MVSDTSERPLYEERRLLRTLERLWVRAEKLLNRLGDSKTNPFYHLGTLGIFLLIVLTVTGIVLTIFYRPGADRAFESVAAISATRIGSLMRSVHRYASDALALVIFLHALKMLIHDRFWGNRWVSWVTGWVMLVNVAIIGVMGYWLVWDERAQWLTDYFMRLLRGSLALSFLNPTIASKTFPFFVIILFLHVFMPILLVVGLLLHLLRLDRSRLWSPRWLMISSTVLLIAISLWRPALSAAPANLNQQVGALVLDGWYLGFLPLAARFGAFVFWGALTGVLLVVVILPWIARGRHVGPAVVGDDFCAGCALCVGECPYTALEMHPRPDNEVFELIAEVNPALCTGCGLCVGTCSTIGIELAALPTNVVVDSLQATLAAAAQRGSAPVVLFACQRHAALGTLPVLEPGETSALHPPDAAAYAPIQIGRWSANGKQSVPLVASTLPCVGMAPDDWVNKALAAGARAAVMVSCPGDDCGFREGPRWLGGRVARRRRSARQRELVHMVEAAPGDRRQLTALLERLSATEHDTEQSPEPAPAASHKAGDWRARVRPLAVGTAMLAVALVLSMLFEIPAAASPRDQGLIRVAIDHEGEIIAGFSDIPPEIATKLPSNVSPEQVLGGERFPVELQLYVDGELVLENSYRARGLRREGSFSAVEYWWLAPGTHQVDLRIKDDENDFRQVFSDQITIAAGEIVNLYFVPRDDEFIVLGDLLEKR